MISIAGGKAYYSMMDGRNREMIIEQMTKHMNNTFKSRNASIAKKLEKLGISEVLEEGVYNYTSDGFHGFYTVKTDKGIKRINIRTIIAGGYNIQCLHMRTLINISK